MLIISMAFFKASGCGPKHSKIIRPNDNRSVNLCSLQQLCTLFLSQNPLAQNAGDCSHQNVKHSVGLQLRHKLHRLIRGHVMWAVHGVSGGGRGGCGNDAPFPTAGIIIFCGYSVVQSDLVHLVLGHPALRGLTRRLGSLSWGLLAMPLVPLLIVRSIALSVLLRRLVPGLMNILLIVASLSRLLTNEAKLDGMFPYLHAPSTAPRRSISSLHGFLNHLHKLRIV